MTIESKYNVGDLVITMAYSEPLLVIINDVYYNSTDGVCYNVINAKRLINNEFTSIRELKENEIYSTTDDLIADWHEKLKIIQEEKDKLNKNRKYLLELLNKKQNGEK